MNNASSAQRLFRIPHNTEDELNDNVVPPEVITAHEEPPIGLPVDDGRGGDTFPRDVELHQAIVAERRMVAEAQQRREVTCYGVVFGAVVMCIGGIVVRRLLINISWSDILRFFE